MSGTKETFTAGAMGDCADIPVSPEEDAQICASAQPPFVGPVAPPPAVKNWPKLNSHSNKPRSFSY